MALTTTTSSASVGVNDTQVKVTSATGFAVGSYVQMGEEFSVVTQGYDGTSTTVPLRRGLNGTFPTTHPSGCNVTVGLGSDFSQASATVIVPYPLSGRRRKVLTYGVAGAITLPSAGEDMLAIIDGTSALAMTIAAPTKDNDGALLYVAGNGVANHTITFTGGLSGAGTSYDVITVNSSAPIVVVAMAINGLWNSLVAVPMAGTVTNITGTVA